MSSLHTALYFPSCAENTTFINETTSSSMSLRIFPSGPINNMQASGFRNGLVPIRHRAIAQTKDCWVKSLCRHNMTFRLLACQLWKIHNFYIIPKSVPCYSSNIMTHNVSLYKTWCSVPLLFTSKMYPLDWCALECFHISPSYISKINCVCYFRFICLKQTHFLSQPFHDLLTKRRWDPFY